MCSIRSKSLTNVLYIVTIILLSVLLSLHFQSKPEDKVVIKEVVKKVIIPEKVIQFDTVVKVKPIYVLKENKELLDKYDTLKDSLKRELFKKSIKKNVYKEVFENDSVRVDIHVETTGTLDKLSTAVKVKPSEFEYTEREITHYKYPKLSIYTGGGVLSGPNGTVMSGHLGFVNKKGFHVELSYNTRKEWGVTIKKDIFTKY